jgi:hypothetical protein
MLTINFESGKFGVQPYEDGTARWTLEFANGKKHFSYRLFNSADEAETAVKEEYIPRCKARRDRGERMWAFFTVLSPKTGKPRPVFYDGE